MFAKLCLDDHKLDFNPDTEQGTIRLGVPQLPGNLSVYIYLPKEHQINANIIQNFFFKNVLQSNEGCDPSI